MALQYMASPARRDSIQRRFPYPLLYRLEKRNWIRGRWIEKPGQRRRRYYRLTASGKNVLSKQRAGWREFVEAINLITGIQHA